MSSVAARARAAPLSLVHAVPTWAWLAGLVTASALVRYAFARRIEGPWIVVDEIVYSELAKSFASSGHFLIREQPAAGAFGVVYPVLISPAYLLFDSVPQAYAAVKAINSVVISLTVVPAYLLARTVLRTSLALAAAALAVAVPSMLYAGMVMTESAFYPLFVLVAYLLVRALDVPTLGRSLALLAAVAAAYGTRAQAVALVPAVATAPLLLVALRRAGLGALAAFRTLYASLGAAVVLVVSVQLARGKELEALLGAYRTAAEVHYDAREVARWLLYHVAELDLYLAVAPVAAFLLLLAVARTLPPRDQALLAACVSLSGWLVLEVATFASRHALRIEERNLFYLAPIFLTALLLWVERGAPRPRIAAFAAVGAAAALPLAIPFDRFVNVSAQSDTLALLVWWDVWDAIGGPVGRLLLVVWAFTFAIAALLLIVPARYALVVPAVVMSVFVVSLVPIESGTHGIRRASAGAVFQGMTASHHDWVDRAVGRDASVAAIWSGPPVDRLFVHENEFFSRSVGPVYYLGEPLPGELPQTPLVFDAGDGALDLPDGQPATARYALIDDGVPLAGRTVARDVAKHARVVRVPGSLRLTYAVIGVYADGWAAPELTYTRYRCRGGTLAVAMDSDPSLFRTDQRVVARVEGRVVARGIIPRVGNARLRVPLQQSAAGHCVARFTVSPSAVPKRPDDTRRLGTHYRRFSYRP